VAQAIPMVMLAGTAISAMGAVSQANAQQASHQFNAQLNERDATVATQQASAEAVRIKRESDLAQGRMIAGFGASGLSVDGSALDALAESAGQAQLDIETVKYRGNLKSMGYHDSARLDRMAGDTAEQQGKLRTASEVLTGVGRTAASYSTGTRRIAGTNSYAY
jgi:hypothetical protein